MSNKMQLTPFILSVNCSTCFEWSLHPSSGAQITVSTASGTGQPLLLPVATVEELRLNFTTKVGIMYACIHAVDYI